MKFISTFIFTCFIFTFWSQDLKEVNRSLREEYTQLKKEHRAILNKVIVLEPTINKYKHEIDSTVKGLNLGSLGKERSKLFRYRDSLAYGGVEIDDVVAFSDVIPDNDVSLPFGEISRITKLPDIRKISPTVVIDSFPVEVENRKLEAAIYSLSRSIDVNTGIIEEFTEVSKTQESLLERLSSFKISYNNTMTRVKSFNNQLADTMAVWRADCAAGKANCKIEYYYGEPVADKSPLPPPPNESAENEVFSYVDQPAEFPGGKDALNHYLAKNISYPQSALDKKIEGKCYLQFIVSAKGNISNVKVIRGVPDCPECDKEAVRVVKAMPNWVPGENSGKTVNSTVTLPVSFKQP